MEEMALRWVERVGFPILVACTAMYAVYKLFSVMQKAQKELTEVLTERAAEVKKTAEDSQKIIEANTIATNQATAIANANTAATRELSAAIKENTRSCKFEQTCKYEPPKETQ